MGQLNRCLTTCGVFLFLALASVALSAQTLTTLHSFNQTDGSSPYAGLMQANNGNLYGTTSAGGANGDGTVFEITTSGALTTMHNFNHRSPTDGAQPYSWLIQARDGNLYGTTTRGGSHNAGIVYRITTSGTLKAMHDLDYSPDGALPYAGLVQASNGSFYGTAPEGGGGAGTAFLMTTFGQLTAIYEFGAHGAQPVAGLVQASNRNFYGTTAMGGSTAVARSLKSPPTARSHRCTPSPAGTAVTRRRRWSRVTMETCMGQRWLAEPITVTTPALPSKSARTARLRCCTSSTGRMAPDHQER
jgi:uncharacterized repeat protein (TIGR03803 family)